DELPLTVGTLRKQHSAVQCELKALQTTAADEQRYLRLVDGLTEFGERLRSHAEAMDVTERQKIIRLLAKEVVVSNETITIRHCLPIPAARSGAVNAGTLPEEPEPDATAACYLLRSGSSLAIAGKPVFALVRRFVSRPAR